MMHPATELRFLSPEIGCGVFALQRIPLGTITWATDPLDQRFTPDEVSQFHPLCADAVRKYAYVDRDGDYVLCWDHGRYVNHSCDANCLSAGFQFEFAVRDIAAGEQLTDDYGLLNLTVPMTCHCGAPACRRLIGRHDIEGQAETWDSIVALAFPCIGKVAQPLWSLLENTAEIESILRGERPVPSCTLHRLRD